MIISHTRRFILIKSIKTAGTSVEAALSNFCGGDDVVTPLNDFAFNRDETGASVHRAMNADRLVWWDREMGQHVDALTMRSRLPTEVWSSYFKLSIARNPWDRVVSLFTWKARNDPTLKPQKSILNRLGVPFDAMGQTRKLFLRFVRDNLDTNDRFYMIDGELCVDFVIRYENLVEDLRAACKKIGLPADIALPRLKSGFRPGQDHYSRYYDAQSKAIVAERHRNDIRLFGYKFEEA
jgi:hypothetical protein